MIFNKFMNINKNLTIEETFNLAVKNHQESKTNIAQNLYNQVLKIDPNHTDANNNLGLIFQKLGENQKAIGCFEKAISINPNYTDAHNNLGTVFFELKEFEKAKNCYEKVIEINPSNLRVYNNLGKVFFKLKELFKRGINLLSDSIVTFW